jgi:hypothetical protein
MAKKRKKKGAKDPGKHPLSPLAYAIISLVAFIIGIGLLLLFIFKADDLIAQGINEKVFYVLLLPLGLSAAAFLFGAMRSYARYKGKVFSGVLELGGPVVLFILVAAGGFTLVPGTGPFDFTIILLDSTPKTVLKSQGEIKIIIGNDIETDKIDENGSVDFKSIPAKFKNKEVPIQINAPGWQFTNGKTSTQCKLEGNRALITIERDSSLSTIAGLVLDEEKNSIVGAKVIVKDIITHTDENGRFTIRIPPEKQEEKQSIRVQKQGYENFDDFVYPASKQEIEIVLPRR